jgi:hypothetical protein
MNFSLFKTGIFLVFCLNFSDFNAFAGIYNHAGTDSTDLFSIVRQAYGPDQVLMNGLYPENYDRDVIGHPFFMDNLFYPGYVIVHDQKFDHLFLKYNIYDQQIIVSPGTAENSPLQVIPPNAFVSGFLLNGRLFRKYCFNGEKAQFYQVVYDGRIKCLYSFSKGRNESFHTSRNRSFAFTGEIKKSWLLMDQQQYSFHSLRSFLSNLPTDSRPEVRVFCRKSKLRLKYATDQEIRRLMEFCDHTLNGK